MPLIPSKSVKSPDATARRIAINVIDLTRLDSTIGQILLAGKIDLDKIIVVDKLRVDERAVAFDCDLLMAATTVDIIRSEDRKAGQYATRAYLFGRSAWSKLPSSAVLTRVNQGKGTVELNPAYFPESIEHAPYKPLERTQVDL